jgi:anti-sigma B factor antagonist
MEELEASDAHFGIEQSLDDSGDPVITLSGELDIASADAFRAAMEIVIGETPGKLVFDLRQLAFMDSSGLAVMVYVANNVEAVELRHASSIVRRVVEATGLSEVLRLGPT